MKGIMTRQIEGIIRSDVVYYYSYVLLIDEVVSSESVFLFKLPKMRIRTPAKETNRIESSSLLRLIL